MTTEEKLKHFQDSTIKSAYEKSTVEIYNYKEALEKNFEQYKKEKQRLAEFDIIAEKDGIIRENNEKFSIAQNQIRKELTKKSMDVAKKILDEMVALLNEFKKTPAYKDILIKQIIDVRTYLRWGEEQVIYLDASDTELKEELEKETNTTLIISEEPHLGGIKAVINDNILIDNSFATRLEELRENFNLTATMEKYRQKYLQHGGRANE